jgi:tetratricopeptide (TPR) repeat protein
MLIVIALCGAVELAEAQAKPPQSAEADGKEPGPQAAALFEAGQKAHEAGKLEEAVRLYGEALNRDPMLWQAEFQRGLAYLALNRLPEARASITRVNEQLAQFAEAPEWRAISARAQITLGEIALAENKYAEAEKSFRRALELNPRAGRAHSGLAEILIARGQFADAVTEAKAALEAGDDRAATHALLGEALALNKNYDAALASLDEALKREPRTPGALRSRAEVFMARHQLPRAISDLQAALALEKIAPTMLRLAEVYDEANEHAEAAHLYQQILAVEPANNEARTGLAAVLIASGKSAEAMAELEALIKADPHRAALRAQLGELYLAAQPDKALEQYAAAAKIEPSQASHRIGVGAALVKLRRFQEATVVLRQILEQPPPAGQVYFAHTNLATALFELQDYAMAAREYAWILDHQKDPKRAAIALYFLGICFDKLGDYAQSLKAYERFLELAPADNQLEIEKVKLRLPPLKRQINKGQSKPIK